MKARPKKGKAKHCGGNITEKTGLNHPYSFIKTLDLELTPGDTLFPR
jgi:hypothetical protein